MIDRATFPRDKICGDGVSGWVVSVLAELDGDLLMKLHELRPAVQQGLEGPKAHADALGVVQAVHADDHRPALQGGFEPPHRREP